MNDNMKTIFVAREFSPAPAGRFFEDGSSTGQKFREKFLLPAFENGGVIVDFFGTELPGSSFFEEAFGGLVREGMTEAVLNSRLKIRSPRESDEKRIRKFIHDEAVRSGRLT